VTMTIHLLDHGELELIDYMGDDQRVVDAARVSVSGEKVRAVRDNEKLIRYLARNEHWTPFEAVRFTFRVKAPIFVARQWMRHRAWSYNEQSARYGEMKDEFYVPSLERLSAGGQSPDNKQASGKELDLDITLKLRRIIADTNLIAYSDYKELLGHGLSRELARMVLPVNLYTGFYASTDLRNLLAFCKLRDHDHAQYEIRVYAKAMRELAREVAPLSVGAAE